jgi:plasmid stability protein
MSMVVTFPDRVAARLRTLAISRGESVDDIATELIEASLGLPHPPASDALAAVVPHDGQDALEAFFGCGDSGDSRPMTIKEMRRDLAARKLAGGTHNI